MHWFPTGYDLRLETNAHDHNIQAIVKKIDRAIKNSERKLTFMRTLMVFVFDISKLTSFLHVSTDYVCDVSNVK